MSAPGQSYPAELLDAEGRPILPGATVIQFTDASIQPGSGGGGGGLPTGWTQAGDPADVSTQGGGLYVGTGDLDTPTSDYVYAGPSPGQFGVSDMAGVENYSVGVGVGIVSVPTSNAGNAFRADPTGGGTVALDCGTLPIVNLPTADPHIAGALWNNAGTPAISSG